MDYHGINMKGPFKGQRVSSLPTWTSDDTGRELYLTTDNKRYYANNVGWIDPDVDKIWTYQDTAPIGWSIITGTTDSLLACKGGGYAYNASGGTQAGTWTQTGHTHTGTSHTHTTGDFRLLEAHMPSHTHIIYNGASFNSNYTNGGVGGTVTPVGNYNTTQSTGGDQIHNHGSTGSGGTGATSSSGTAATYRPLANVGIVIEKD